MAIAEAVEFRLNYLVSSSRFTRQKDSEAPANSPGIGARSTWGMLLVLVICTLVVFGQVLRHDYVSYDDGDYVYENKMVQRGLSADSIKWAFTEAHAANWHPLTWLSHMLDWQLYGNKPGAHHFSSVILHVLNAALLFFLLRKMTGMPGSSLFVAALFALHPLHVESVAWLAERKDVLSTFFGILTLMGYVFYAHARADASATTVRRSSFYLLTLLSFACGLMSKPMLVTLPFVLLLLDLWPLGRMEPATVASDTPALRDYVSRLRPLILEKAPFFVLSALSSYITFKVQLGKTVQSLSEFSITDRIANVLVTYVVYLWKMIWPAKLAFFYPLVEAPPLGKASIAGIFLIAVTILAVWQMKKRPFIAAGWFWYLGTLVPVVGLVHVGEQSHADRYTYIPSIGVFLVIAWAVAGWAAHRRVSRAVLVSGAFILLAACAGITWRQVGYWKDSRAMLGRALAVTRQNFLAHNNYGVIIADEGKELEAQNRSPEARAKFEEAIRHYTEAVRWKPHYARAYDNWASSLMLLGRFDEAIEKYQKALSLNPREARTHYNLAVTLARQNRFDETIAECREALRLDPTYVDAHYDLGSALSLKGQLEEAAQEYEKFLLAKPEDGLAHFLLANTQARLKKLEEAVTHYREAIRLKPDFLESYTKLAWLMATSSQEAIRNGADAVRIAEKAGEMTQFQNPTVLGVLAAAYAEAGRFDDASNIARKGMEIGQGNGREQLVASFRQQLELFQAGKPIRSN